MDFGDSALPEKFWEKVYPEPNTGCWLWGAGGHIAGPDSYGVFYPTPRQKRYAHRLMLSASLGRELLPGMEALHGCDVPRCVNPDHLREGTHAENMSDCKRRGRSAAIAELFSECSWGHPFDAENTLWKTRWEKGVPYRVRTCRKCNKRRCKERRTRIKEHHGR